MEKSKIIFDDLIKFADIFKKETNVSDVYIKEFIMFISICISSNLQLIYPFAEFNKLINTVINNQKIKFAIMNHMNFKDNMNKNILTILHFSTLYDKKLQDFFIQKMMEYFSHQVIATRINLFEITFRANSHSKYILNISNNLNVQTVKKLFIKHSKMNGDNDIDIKHLNFFNNKIEMYDTKYLIDYTIDDENDIIDVQICNF
jgi:hypothetical protein